MILVGTSGWSYPSGKGTWNGVFYPSRRPRGFDELAYYAERFDTVEVNSTFYRMPEPALSQAWARRTPPRFQFAVKLFQKFTHPDLYVSRPGVTDWDLSSTDVDLFRRGVAPLAESGKLIALLAQFPASFHASPETRDYLDWLLEALAGYDVAVELRHRSWSDAAAETHAQLAARGAAWALIDEPKFRDSIRQSLTLALGRLTYIRLHGRNAANWWEPDATEDRYNYLYSPDELAPVASAAEDADVEDEPEPPRKRKVLLYMNNHFSAKAVANAAVLRHQLGQILPADYLPEMVSRYPQLDGIVTTAGLPL
ncbi:MAG TPA: DUF72 domain-containing protein [Vicinamibacterales bacterium]|nr:DUF72 domain-containing protein [Vicinamibacterales bacterium]